MHKIDLNSPEQAPTAVNPETANTPVDPQPSIDNNQTSTTSVSSSSRRTMAKSSNKALLIAALIAIVAGVGSGYVGSKLYAQSQGLPSGDIETVATEGAVKNGDVFGSPDTSTFKDSAKGYLVAGGLDNEGTHHLLRDGGTSQTVYLTSSVTDLSTLEGMEVEVWGETFKGQKAGWLMDVGRVQVVNVEGQIPTEE
ncbi:MAG: hypothetical protein QG639_47 [Patescibacteria group bacterium]|jgi:hypothetical protein|nr:hypothetical protein [Patescibacteria group bacterium]